jgi:hypothetical protein
MTISLVNSWLGSAGSTSITIDSSTGSPTLLILALGAYSGASNDVTDSLGNTWVSINNAGASASSKMAYCINPTSRSTNHSLTFTASYENIAAAAFSGVSGIDGTNFGKTEINSSTASIATPSLTPSQAGALVVSIATFLNQTTAATVSGATMLKVAGSVGGTSEPIALAYQIQTSIAASVATFTVPSAAGPASASAAVFVPSGAGGANLIRNAQMMVA